jgi:hypothetical protein
MRFCAGLIFLCAILGFAQSDDDLEVMRAKAGIDKIRSLVESGALPRAQLEKAEAAVEDARDAAILRKTLYGSDLTEEQSNEMIAAAGRRFERRTKAFDDAKKLVDAGVEAQASLAIHMDDLTLAKKECDLAETRAKLTAQLAEMARNEEALMARLAQEPPDAHRGTERFDGNGVFTTQIFNRIESLYQANFGKAMPVSAMGDTAVHRAMGFDHTGRVDVALNPDQPEGAWLIQYLTDHKIPFFAFRQAVPGKATGAHIHLGPMSTAYKLGG